MAGKTAAMTIRSLVKERASLRSEAIELRAHWERVDGALRYTERLLLTERARTLALGETITAAGTMLDAGEHESVRLILLAGRRAFVNRLRDEVAHGPGGIRSAENESNTQKDGNG